MKKGLVGWLLVFLLSGCAKPLDLGQIKDFSAEPVWTIDLFYARLAGEDFYYGDYPLMEVNDTIPFEIFSNRAIRDGLEKMIIYFDITNPFTSEFAFEVEFLDEYNQVRQADGDIIPAAPSADQPFRKEYTITINKSENPEIVLTKRLHLRFARLDTVDLRNQDGQLEIKSKGDFYMVLQ